MPEKAGKNKTSEHRCKQCKSFKDAITSLRADLSRFTQTFKWHQGVMCTYLCIVFHFKALCEVRGQYLSLQARLVTLQVLPGCFLLHQLAPHLIHLSHNQQRGEPSLNIQQCWKVTKYIHSSVLFILLLLIPLLNYISERNIVLFHSTTFPWQLWLLYGTDLTSAFQTFCVMTSWPQKKCVVGALCHIADTFPLNFTDGFI